MTSRDIFELDDRGRRGHHQKLFKKGFRLHVKSLLSVIELSMIGIPYRHSVLIAVQ